MSTLDYSECNSISRFQEVHHLYEANQRRPRRGHLSNLWAGLNRIWEGQRYSWFDRCAFTRNSKVEIDQVMMFQCTTSLSTMNVRASLLLVVHHWVGEPFPSGGESRVLRAPTDWRRGEQLRNMRSLDSIDVTVSSPHSNDTNPSSLTLRIVLALCLWIFPNPRR